MNDIQLFNNPEFGDVHSIKIDGKSYFNASDIATALGYSNPRDAIKRHCKGVVKADTPTNSGVQAINYIPEGDVYRLIARSNLPSADKFERWIFDEVLPSICKTGSYSSINRESLSPTLQMLYALADSSAAIELRQKDIEKRQDDQDAKVAYFGEKLANMKDIFLEPVGDWKEDINKRVREIAIKAYSGDYKQVFTEMYAQLELQANTSLERRCNNKKARMEKAGNTKDAIKNGTTKLAIIYDDKRLRTIFETIVKKWAMSYCA